jgi:ADP-heptose:LPS heptosyltransferase
VHVGAQLASRRWPARRHAAVGDALAARGWRVVFTGSAAERALVDEAVRAMRHPAVDLTGRTTLWTLGALIASARLLVCNDTGVSHVAAATRTPSVVVACGSDVARWAPLDARRHAVLWRDAPCRPCAQPACPTAHECATGVTVDEVVAAALQALARAPAQEPRHVAA